LLITFRLGCNKYTSISANLQNIDYFCTVVNVKNIKLKMSDWKERLGVVYSTNPDFKYETEQSPNIETLPKERQNLRVWRDTHGRAGKIATVVRGFVGNDEALENLGKILKRKIGVGGSVKNGEIIIQGENRERVLQILIAEGYSRTKKV